MADLLGAMRVEIVGDNAKLDKSIDSSKKKTEDYGKSNEKLAKSLKTLFSGVAFAAVAKKIFDISKRAAELSAAGEEIRSKFNAVFKDGAQDVQAWAEDYADSVGRSDTQTLSFLATLQDTFVPMGIARDKAAELSKQMVVLAGDVGSFNDVSQADVIRDFQSAAVGNTETVRKYGIVINEANTLQEALNSGLIESKDQLTEQVKIQARLNLIIQGTTDAQGDLLRTQESTTNVNAALNSQIEKTLESYGKVVNEGLLPFKKNLLEEITTINQNIKAHFLRQKVIAGDATLIENLTLKEIEQTKAERELQQAKDNLAASEASIAANLASSNIQLQNAAKATQASLVGQVKLIESRERAVEGIQREAAAIERAILEERQLLDEKIALTEATNEGTDSTENNTEAVDENTEALDENEKGLQKLENRYDNNSINFFYERLMTNSSDAKDQTKEDLEESAETWDDYFQNIQDNALESFDSIAGFGADLFSALAELRKANAAQQTAIIEEQLAIDLAAIDSRYNAELQTLTSLTDETLAYNAFKLEELRTSLDEEDQLRYAANVAETARKEELAQLEQDILDEKSVAEKIAKNKIAKIEYDAELASWRLRNLSIIGLGAQAAMQAFAQLGPIGGAIASAGIATLQTIQLAVLSKAKPVLQTFAEGGTVAGASFTGDNVPILVNSKEDVLTNKQSSELMSFIKSGMGNTTNNSNGNITINSMFSLGNESKINDAAKRLFPALQREAQRRGTSLGGL